MQLLLLLQELPVAGIAGRPHRRPAAQPPVAAISLLYLPLSSTRTSASTSVAGAPLSPDAVIRTRLLRCPLQPPARLLCRLLGPLADGMHESPVLLQLLGKPVQQNLLWQPRNDVRLGLRRPQLRVGSSGT